MKQKLIREPMIPAIKESKRQHKQQNHIRPQALLTAKNVYLFLRNLMKSSK